ncbi:LuxR family transcriptional regulator [Tranquillimonas rosea]|uniref:LuxR family transcriptional regulator n=1 Tax=Tranquillimonas rosea TaxID=641238 RepID=A0A1H9P9X2_9RHOB|nr:LuxR family transcriptional regulator [Tranquillimonas rosea]SER44917.1 LuxR family transcriptional regulator [Tranquillimonas rosea]
MLKTVERLLDSVTMQDVWSIHSETMAEYGFDRLLYGFTRFRTTTGFGDSDDFLILSNHDSAYTDRFVKGGLYFHAPMVRWAAQNNGACSWRWMWDHEDSMSESERAVMEFNRSHDVVAGYSIAFRDASVRNKGAIALTARRGLSQDDVDAVWAQNGREIVALNTITHLKVINLPYENPSRTLTDRQREVLEWVRDGKTAQDIAQIMGLTSATVEKHLRLARDTLDVDTTAQAVLKASFQNQIFVLQQ